MKNIEVENFIKNLIIVGILLFTYFQINDFLRNSPIATEKSVLGSVLVAVSILIVTACFGAFAFTYEKVEHRRIGARLLAHFATGVLMLLIGLSLEMTSVIVKLLMGDFLIFNLSLSLLYVGVILYDFWDLKRAEL